MAEKVMPLALGDAKGITGVSAGRFRLGDLLTEGALWINRQPLQLNYRSVTPSLAKGVPTVVYLVYRLVYAWLYLIYGLFLGKCIEV